MAKLVKLTELLNYTGQILEVERFHDYCPNGLQVQGRSEINSIISGVTASMALLQAAEQAGADLVLVHHGYFWRNEDVRVTGIKRARLKFLLERDINLVAYHLPLDAHQELGNNAQLARVLGFNIDGWAGEQNIIAHGALSGTMSFQSLGQHIASCLGRTPMLIGELSKPVRCVAWCTGAAQDFLQQAISLGVDAFISGEISEQTVHLARESGVCFVSAGHHASERYGVQALAGHLAQRFNLQHQFVDIDNPV